MTKAATYLSKAAPLVNYATLGISTLAETLLCKKKLRPEQKERGGKWSYRGYRVQYPARCKWKGLTITTGTSIQPNRRIA
jgi:hypothetical protein